MRSSAIDNSTDTETVIRSDVDFPKRAQSIKSHMSVATYTADLFSLSQLDSKHVAPRFPVSPIPPWELHKPHFDIDHTTMKKDENPNILAVSVKSHIEDKYRDHLKIFTDGSVLENKQTGAAFVIPAFRIEKSYYLGKNYSIFTAELYAILMALRYLVDFPRSLFQIVFCVDSKSVLYSLRSTDPKIRAELIIEIRHLIHSLIIRGTNVSFCWIPSHCNIFANDWADRAAKNGAKNSSKSETVTIPFSVQEGYKLLDKGSYTNFIKCSENKLSQSGRLSLKICNVERNLNLSSTSNYYTRKLVSLFFRFRLNAFRTKYIQNAKCLCGDKLDINHILFRCQPLRQLLPKSFTDLSLQEDRIIDILQNTNLICDIIKSLTHSSILSLL